MDAYAAFERDVAEHLRDDALQAMAEATGGYGSPANVTLLDRDQLDAVNYRAHGIIEIGGTEFTFEFEDGNWNGSLLRAWQSDKPFERHVPIRWALQPKRALVDEAVFSGRGPVLLLKWDAILKNKPDVAAIPGKYAYDKHFAPGGKAETYWRTKAAEHHFELVSEETAAETRKQLEAATEAR